MNKFRASYSVLSKWATGLPDYQEEAVRMYFKMPSDTASYMKEGQDLHKEWENEVINNKRMPAVFGGKPLSPKHYTERKIVADVNEWLEIVGVIDLLEYVPLIDGWQVTDYKSGDGGKGFYKRRNGDEITDTDIPVPHKTSTTHLGKPQLGIYAALANYMLEREGETERVKRVKITHYNQVTQEVDTAYKWVSGRDMAQAIDWVITYASEMHNYLLSGNAYADPYKFLGITNELEG